MEDRLHPKTAPQCTREPYTAGVLEAPAGYSHQAARTGRTVFMSGPVFGDRSLQPRVCPITSEGRTDETHALALGTLERLPVRAQEQWRRGRSARLLRPNLNRLEIPCECVTINRRDLR